jgi:hypothetical protein
MDRPAVPAELMDLARRLAHTHPAVAPGRALTWRPGEAERRVRLGGAT